MSYFGLRGHQIPRAAKSLLPAVSKTASPAAASGDQKPAAESHVATDMRV